MTYRFHTADVFTAELFGGNQLAVLPDARGLADDQMQRIAREFNYSETVFVLPPARAENTRRLRIFTPVNELPFAGHPTVGTAFVLAVTGEIQVSDGATRIVFEEGAGDVPVLIRMKDGSPTFAQLTAPRLPERKRSPVPASEVARMLSLEEADVIDDGYLHPEVVSCGVPFLHVPLGSRGALERARVRGDAFEAQAASGTAEIYMFVEDEASAAHGGVRGGDGVVRARMFAPALGVPEDPATGSAAAALAGYLAWRSGTRDGTLHWTIHQGVEMGRPSRIETEADVSNGDIRAIRVGGESVLVTSGKINV